MENKFIRVRSVADILVVVSIISFGLLLAILSYSDSVNTIGIFLMAVGVFLFFVLKSSYKNPENGHLYKKEIINFAKQDRNFIINGLSDPSHFDVTLRDKGDALLLTIYYNRKEAYMQLYEYIPYTYRPCTKVYHYKRKDINRLINK